MEDNEKLEDLLPGADPESQLKSERDELYDRLLRKQAEFDNYKAASDLSLWLISQSRRRNR